MMRTVAGASDIEQAARLIDAADGLIIAAGAGMGVDSGLPDFRGTTGFWRAYPALARAQIQFESIASPAAFERDPALAWGFYGHRLALYRQTVPHGGFNILRRIGAQLPNGYFVYTSNVDGQFQRAGFDDASVLECHGSIHHLQCINDCVGALWPAEAFVPVVDQAQCRLLGVAPQCPECGALARPAILMFGDWGWNDQRTEAQAGHFAAWRARVRHPVVIELGAGVSVPSVRIFGERQRCPLIRINPRESTVASAEGLGISMGAQAALRQIADALVDLGWSLNTTEIGGIS